MLTNGSHQGDTGETTLADGTATSKDAALLAAQGELEEASMAIGAAVTVGYLAEEFDTLLRRAQQTLSQLARGLAGSAAPHSQTLAELDAICARYATEIPADFAAASGRSETVSLLQLARAVTRRAERALWALPTAEHTTTRQAAVFVNRLADVLVLVAYRIHRGLDTDVAVGWCATRPEDVVGPTPS